MPSISCIDVSYEHPDRTSVFDGLSLTLGPGLSSLVGRNGAGKTTLLRLVAGELIPGSGTVLVDGVLAYVPQDLLTSVRGVGGAPRMADLLGVRSRLAALARIEEGSVDEADFAALGDEWDVAERTSAVIAKMGLPAGPGDLERPVAQLSGGERTLAAVAGALLAHADVLLLDEPTNNLDAGARRRLFDEMAEFTGGGRCAVVVSHDLELLERADVTCELHDGEVRSFAGPYSAMREAIEGEQAAAAQAATSAREDLRAARRQRDQAQQMNATRARIAKKAEREKRVPKIISGMRADAAEKAAGKLTDRHAEKVSGAAEAAREANDAVRRARLLRISLPDPELPRSREVVVSDAVRLLGPERVRLTGANGSGKTTLLRSLVGGDAAIAVPFAYLAQDLPVPAGCDRGGAHRVAEAGRGALFAARARRAVPVHGGFGGEAARRAVRRGAAARVSCGGAVRAADAAAAGARRAHEQPRYFGSGAARRCACRVERRAALGHARRRVRRARRDRAGGRCRRVAGLGGAAPRPANTTYR